MTFFKTLMYSLLTIIVIMLIKIILLDVILEYNACDMMLAKVQKSL